MNESNLQRSIAGLSPAPRHETVQFVTLHARHGLNGVLVWKGPSGLDSEQSPHVGGIKPLHLNDRLTIQVVRFDGREN